MRKLSRRGEFLLVIVSLSILSAGFVLRGEKDFEIARNLDIFVTLFREINTFYVDETNPEKLIESGIQGMLESLDPYTTYIPEKDQDDFKFMTTGKYGGIGALIRKAGEYTMISEPYEGFPAQISGIRAGDTILAIDGVSLKGKTISEVSEMLKGTPNTSLTLLLRRYGTDSTIRKTFNRQQVSIPNVPYYGLMGNNIGYILLNNFTKDAGKEVKAAFLDLKNRGANSIVLDLRGNPGGLLNEAVNVVNIWVSRNQEVVSTKGRVSQWYSTYKTEMAPADTTIPLAVLVSRGSASASEIVAGALQDLDRAVVIGQKTFGKGLVQTTRPLSYNAQLKITTAKYYIPSGRCIQALDYTHRNDDGSVGFVHDSLKSEFQTRNGRKVFDGGGIDPDINIEKEAPGNITIALYAQNLIFDFATVFASENQKIDSPSAFYIYDELYASFVKYLQDKHFDYTTQSSEKLAELEKSARREGYFTVISPELALLKEKLQGDKETDLQIFRKEISDLLKDEIVSRFFYQKGRIETSLADDPEVAKAMEILSGKTTYFDILNGSYKGETVFAVKSH
ncbi:MAG: S41 family peptidase [Bacteroidales bacterium]|nr:S41 family peptidase [Bacteroidales bacterium]